LEIESFSQIYIAFTLIKKLPSEFNL